MPGSHVLRCPHAHDPPASRSARRHCALAVVAVVDETHHLDVNRFKPLAGKAFEMRFWLKRQTSSQNWKHIQFGREQNLSRDCKTATQAGVLDEGLAPQNAEDRRRGWG